MILGAGLGIAGVAAPIATGAATMFGPRGACLASPDGPLYVSDTGHHRLLVWSRRPRHDHDPADFVFGQPDFVSEGRNARGDASAATLNVPTGVAAGGGALAVADAWNHRVLIWHRAPVRAGQLPDVVLGQADFSGAHPNRGMRDARADTLNWYYGVALEGQRLFVADTGNRRVLVWNSLPQRHGAPADLVLGQRGFTTRDENAGAGAGATGMRWPHGVAMRGNALLVTDAGNNRVMVWASFPSKSGTPCDFVLGQKDVQSVDHNQAAYFPTAASLNMPYSVAVQRDRVIVADTANSRLLAFVGDALSMNAPARWLSAQETFGNKGDNRWGVATRNSLCWPYGVTVSGDTVVVADAGNNRALLWETVP